MGQEFVIKSTALEDKINQLLPSQGGQQAGVDLSASTMVVPIVDLTETAEGSEVRADLQTALSHKTVTSFDVQNTTSTLVSTTGYYRVFGSATAQCGVASAQSINFFINDGATSKVIWSLDIPSSNANNIAVSSTFDFVVFLEAGDTLQSTGTAHGNAIGSTRQIADISGNLVDP